MAGSEAEWITVANNLLLKCHIHLRIRELEDCDANVFIALYQSILGEKVPDLIAIPRSQEDDAHNVQAVIDSLALDYLQVSLSHITGENIVKGDKESIRNLLEIFDGLLEYLTEHISETSHEKSAEGPNEMRSKKASTVSHEEVLHPPSSSFLSRSRTSYVEDMEIPSADVIPSARKLGEPIQSAIPLHPPYHPSEPRAPCPIGKEYLRSSHISSAVNSTGEGTTLSVESDNRVLLTSTLPKDSKQEMGSAQIQSPRTRKLPKAKRYESRPTVSSWDSSFSQSVGKRLTEQELHAVSKKLSQRLSELDWMLKSALGDRIKEKTGYEEDNIGDEEMESGNEDTLSQHSDSIMECGPKKQRPGTSRHRSRSLSPSPVNKKRQSRMERRRQRTPKAADIRQFQAKAITEAFERELRRNEVQENIGSLGLNNDEETEKIYREAVHKGTPKRSQPWKTYSRKTTTPSPRGGLLKPNKAVPMKVNENSLLPLLLEEFPFLYVSGETLSKMWKQQITQVEQLRKDACRENRSKKKLQDEIEEALKRHDLLTALVKKEYEHNKRLQDFKDRIHRQKLTQSKINENRQQIVRARKYYDDYRVQLRAKMMRMRTREEMIFKKLFEEGLQIQKQRLRDLRKYAKEKRAEQKRQHQNELDSMENYYKDQFSLLAEAISQQRQELKARERSQAQTLYKVKRELRSKMEKEIQQLQCMITQSDDDAFFRELEAERFRSRLHMASFQYSKNPFL
ncbi:centrosomal protein of 95 kDa isoform X2 [Suricata suricatta]|uniref:centrosomal protein of 95 kDa isoform X2 n=1 Tax=Suricata suricatta TaxID=37032 RepID=UPI00115574AC|nr:centrosomal protein of 95 kDa isoform X2 [Suricata suricatta]